MCCNYPAVIAGDDEDPARDNHGKVADSDMAVTMAIQTVADAVVMVLIDDADDDDDDNDDDYDDDDDACDDGCEGNSAAIISSPEEAHSWLFSPQIRETGTTQVATQSQLHLPQHGVDAEDSGMLQDFRVWDPVLPSQLQYSALAAEMEVIQLPDLVQVDGPGLRSVKECRQDDGLLHLQFGVQVNTVAIPHGDLQSAEVLTSFGDPLGNQRPHPGQPPRPLG
ncbi:unnamed protein product [Schistocephalus solidus]|uniref:Uncharacterized protein n=1 Tax=Schistocephalus solidus TaxID=70667 RepID=A0A183TCI3_SCHSO|nr:unnamed protein product [Schistocephalus solidus]